MAKDKKYVKFLVSPTGAFGLAYNADDVGELEDLRAAEVVEAGYAQYCDAEGKLITVGVTSAKDDASDLKALTAKAVGFGIEVPKNATAKQVQTLIDESHAKALEDLKTLRETNVKTNDPAKESAAAGAKELKPENAADKGAADSEKA